MESVLRKIPAKSEDIIFRKVDEEYILVPMLCSSDEVEHIYNLNTVGAAIWERIDGQRSIKEIISELSTEYDAPEEVIQRDVVDFLNDLLEAGIIEMKDEGD